MWLFKAVGICLRVVWWILCWCCLGCRKGGELCLGYGRLCKGKLGEEVASDHLPELVLGFQAAEISVVLWLCSLLNSHLYAKSCKTFWKQLYVYLWQLLWGGVTGVLLWAIWNPLVLVQVLLSFLQREKGGRSGPKYVVLELSFSLW